MTTPTLTDNKQEPCNAHVAWWDGEYDGDCILPKDHLDLYHYDGISYFDDDQYQRDNDQERLEALITAKTEKAYNQGKEDGKIEN